MGSGKTTTITSKTTPVQGEPRSIFNASYGAPDTGAPNRGKVRPPKKVTPAKPAKNAAEGMWGDMLR
ncbi:hypothetical protein [Falsirhodobacter sp. 20TX0035]|uniref:hypothetical protein n=1 Tax=Falsirhodobacter sp. 20TX0035 TaxID=3022019 RepID=UPI00232DD7B0|nr:hypothetical protein [Falsirhodobacter sp. 20TX0035]MDB6452583.1 hypothetical protein [Falsirhodobacter sp. 20TX0035]